MSNESEKSIEQYLQQRAKAVGWLCFKFVSPNNRGVPDRIVILPDGETVYIEVKRMTGTLSALQQRMIKKIQDQKARVWVVWSREQIDQRIESWELDRMNEEIAS